MHCREIQVVAVRVSLALQLRHVFLLFLGAVFRRLDADFLAKGSQVGFVLSLHPVEVVLFDFDVVVAGVVDFEPFQGLYNMQLP